jgi:hypothetical protein
MVITMCVAEFTLSIRAINCVVLVLVAHILWSLLLSLSAVLLRLLVRLSLAVLALPELFLLQRWPKLVTEDVVFLKIKL